MSRMDNGLFRGVQLQLVLPKAAYPAIKVLIVITTYLPLTYGSNSCATMLCPSPTLCEVNNGTAQCVCPQFCTSEYSPVCGTDGSTYSNRCFMNVEACKQNKTIEVAYKGSCGPRCKTIRCGFLGTCIIATGGEKCVCHIACTKIYQPVCGTDGVTYANRCFMKRASCLNQKFIYFRQHGPCETDVCAAVKCGYSSSCINVNGTGTCACIASCEKNYAPVCGNDGITYQNECFMELNMCRERRAIQVAHKGSCESLPLSDSSKLAIGVGLGALLFVGLVIGKILFDIRSRKISMGVITVNQGSSTKA